MSQFLEDLWESIFTPGPTPSLLIATNVTFAVLQVVLFVLLVATYSIHFIVLSFLSGGLWWAINWFARELKASQLREAEAEALLKQQQRRRRQQQQKPGTRATSDSETEVETGAAASADAGVSALASATLLASETTAALGKSREVEALERRGELKQRTTAAASSAPTLAKEETVVESSPSSSSLGAAGARSFSGGSQPLSGTRSGVSTEDEWEKVSENENDK